MPERDRYIAGVPCWVDTSQPDPEASLDFYRGLFGWEFENVMPPGSQGKYFLARLRGGEVGAVASIPESAPPVATWDTYIWVDDADALHAELKARGVKIVRDIGDRHYGCRDFDIEDCNGYRICFGRVL